MSNSIQYIKDCLHLHKLEDELKHFEKLTDLKHEELRKWRQLMVITYPQYRKEL